MPKKSVAARQKKRQVLCDSLYKKRQSVKSELVAEYSKPDRDYQAIESLTNKLNKMPRDSSPTRLRKRCSGCHRARGVYTKFLFCRCCLRSLLQLGYVFGGRKSSW